MKTYQKKALFISLLWAFVMFSFFLFIIISVAKDLKIENNLKQEFYEIEEIINNNDINNPLIDRKLNVNVSSSDYIYIEKSIKNYFKDIIYECRRLYSIYNSDYLSTTITYENFSSDGPYFNHTLDYINTTKNELTIIKNNLMDLMNYEKIMSYLEVYELDEYYINLYEELLFDKNIYAETKITIEKNIEESMHILNTYENLFLFLQENATSWYISDGNIYFANEDLLGKYDNLIYNIEKLTFENNDEKI